MSVKTVFAVLATSILFTSCAVLNQPDSADDDLYYGKSTSTKKVKMVPTVDLEKIKRENPSQIDPTKPSGYNNNVTPNPNAAMAYPAYKAQQDSLYRLHPELSGYYQAYSMPPFSLSDEYKRIKAERRQARRLARINNRRYYNRGWGYNNSYYGNYGYNNYGYNNYGYNNWNNGWGYNNWNSFGPSINFGWNSWNGWNSGIGFGWNQPFYSGYNSFYNPWNNYYGNYYQPYYPYYPAPSEQHPNPNPPQSRPRDVVGSNLPATNGGTLENPNPNPQRVTNNNGTTVTPGANPQTPAATNSGGTLINTPNGVQYIAPRTTQSNQAYPSNSTSLENNRSQNEYRQNNPQYFDNSGNNNNQPQPPNPNVNNNGNVPRTTDNYQQNNNNQNYQPRFVEPSRSSSNYQPSAPAPSNSAPRGGSGGGGLASPGMSRPR